MGLAFQAIFVISSQEAADRKGVCVKDRDEAIAKAIAEERSLTDAPLQPAVLSDEIMKIAAFHSTRPLSVGFSSLED